MKPYRLIAAAALAASLTAAAQDLKTEVVVERTVDPSLQNAVRPAGVMPAATLPPVVTPTLSTAEYSLLSPITRSLARLKAVAGYALPEKSRRRGYVSAGYFPTYNAGLQAGYHVDCSKSSALDIHGGFNGLSYKGISADTANYKYNGGNIGADFTAAFGHHSLLTLSAAYSLSTSATPLRSAQTRNAVTAAASWRSAAGGVDYEIAARGAFDRFGAVTPVVEVLTPLSGLSQLGYALEGRGSLPMDDNWGISLGIEADMLRSGADAAFLADPETLGNFTLEPGVYYSLGEFRASAAPRVEYLLGGEGKHFSIAPAVNLAWTPSEMFAIEAGATGGAGFNTARTAIDQWALTAGIIPGSRREVPLDAMATVTFGPWAGLSLSLDGGYSIAREVLMPSACDALSPFALRDVKGWHAGARINYSHRYFNVYAGASHIPGAIGDDRGWYMNPDGANYVIDAGTFVRPLDRLKVGVDYEFRSGRHTSDTALGVMSNLSLRADYSISETVDAFADFENVLCRRYLIVPGVHSQRLHGLAGITWKF